MEIAATTAENRLWRAVLEQVYEDAELPQMEDGSDPEALARARRYLRADNGTEAEHLQLVCEFAEVPFDRVVNFARKRYASVLPEAGVELLRPRRKAPRPQDGTPCREVAGHGARKAYSGRAAEQEVVTRSAGAPEVGAREVAAERVVPREVERVS